MIRPQLPVACAAALPLCAAMAHAHHSPAAFDLTREVIVTGTVADVAWKNPPTEACDPGIARRFLEE